MSLRTGSFGATLERAIQRLACDHSARFSLLLLAALVTAATALFFTRADGRPLVGDGLENIRAALNLVRYGVFSSLAGDPPAPNMDREPLWPALLSLWLWVNGLAGAEYADLVKAYSNRLYFLNALILGLTAAGIAEFARRQSPRPLLAAAVGVTLLAALVLATPRLVFRLNNDVLAIFLVLCTAMAGYRALTQRTPGSFALCGLLTGLLALCKAQFLWIGLAWLLLLALLRWRVGWIAVVLCAVTVAPWLARNAVTLDDAAIAKRGRAVAAIRLMYATQLAPTEHACLWYGFTHPDLRPLMGSVTGLSEQDFGRGERCGRLNREFCYDMGVRDIACSPFPGDGVAMDSLQPNAAEQVFFRGLSLGRVLDRDRRSVLSEIPLTADVLAGYAQTQSAVAWRGLWISGLPVLAVLALLGTVLALATRWWPIAALAVLAHAVHAFTTHNIPRYHAVEIGLWCLCCALLVGHLLRPRATKETNKAGGSVSRAGDGRSPN